KPHPLARRTAARLGLTADGGRLVVLLLMGLASVLGEPRSLLGAKGERMASDTVVVVGGTRGLGREVAQFYADRGRDLVVTGREQAGAEVGAAEIGAATRGIGLDLADPHTIAERLADVGDVQYLVLAAIERDANSVRDYDIEAAMRLVTLKLVGYTAVVHALAPR